MILTNATIRWEVILVTLQICNKRISPEWDCFVRRIGGSHLQTSMWACVKETLGWKAVRLIVVEEGGIIGGLQLLIRDAPLFGLIAHVPRGPLIRNDDARANEFLYTALEQYIQSNRIQYLYLQPALSNVSFAEHLKMANFATSKVDLAPAATCVIDLTQDLETIWSKLQKRRRKAIRKALNTELSVREGTEKDVDTFYALYAKLIERYGGKKYSKSYYEHKWRVLNPAGLTRTFVVEYHSEPVTMHWVIPFGETVISKAAVWSGNYGKLHPNELLEWSVIQWAKAQGYRYYDFEGIPVEAAQALLANQPLPETLVQSATSYKLSFGGQPVLFPPALDRFSNPLLQWLYVRMTQRATLWPWLNELANRLRTHSQKSGRKRWWRCILTAPECAFEHGESLTGMMTAAERIML